MKYVVIEGGMLDRTMKRINKADIIAERMNHGPWPMIIMSICGLVLGAMFAMGLNEIHPLF